MPKKVRLRCSRKISFEKLCEVVDYEEESSAGNNFIRGSGEKQVLPLARRQRLGRDDVRKCES